MSIKAHLVYGTLWLAFGLSHSLLSGATSQAGLGRWTGRGHRLVFNAIAVLQLLAILAIGHWLAAESKRFVISVPYLRVLDALVVVGAGAGVVALRSYDFGMFMGTSQWRRQITAEEPLVIQGLNRRVRHPLYSAALVVIWASIRSELDVATALWVSVYIVMGSRYEERRLLSRYGAAYAAYRAETPAFIPRWF